MNENKQVTKEEGMRFLAGIGIGIAIIIIYMLWLGIIS